MDESATNAEATRTCIGVFYTRHLATSLSRPTLRYPRLPHWAMGNFSVLSSPPISRPLAELRGHPLKDLNAHHARSSPASAGQNSLLERIPPSRPVKNEAF